MDKDNVFINHFISNAKLRKALLQNDEEMFREGLKESKDKPMMVIKAVIHCDLYPFFQILLEFFEFQKIRRGILEGCLENNKIEWVIFALDKWGLKELPTLFFECESVQLFQFLVDRGWDPNSVEIRNIQTALHKSAEGGRLDVVKILLANGAFVNPTDLNGNTPLHLAGIIYWMFLNTSEDEKDRSC